ncbi:Aldehyde/histidinol dehydrogenase [Gigaspora rosea]|uniref:Aldehyde dehydrogenase n=1 Tax=Gigaspora rosea TaxID=44941 RepID=A0A397V2K2_9GLOM|nr:Aldehyde/histidinol dehydrogenase [Gigaspora rosea]
MSLIHTNVDELPQIVQELRKSFHSNLTKPLSYRKEQLRNLYRMINENEQAFCDALYKDLHKQKHEAILGELGWVKQEALDAISNLKSWAEPNYVKVNLGYMLNKCHVRKEPIGIVLIIGTWNYPVNLLLMPFIGAIAAGCTAILKPSELSAHIASLISELFPKYLDQNAYRIVSGGVVETTALLKYRFDHIFYTGSGKVGKIIMSAAAEHLTPVTLELGGKSPVIATNDVDIPLLAKRILWGKLMNCGQTCIAPDYMICERSVQDAFIKEAPKIIEQFYGSDPQSGTSDYCRIINKNHFDRLQNLLNQTKGRIAYGGNFDRDDLYISPTIVADVSKDDKLMEDEIFGPIFPIIVVENLDEAIEYVNSKDIPLALYPFSKSDKTIKHILDNTRSGGTVINDCLMHFTVKELPFGGQGPSGIGSYHGKRSFDTFSHERAIMTTPFALENLVKARYPPYNEFNAKLLSWLFFKKPSKFRNVASKGVIGAVILLMITYVIKKMKF